MWAVPSNVDRDLEAELERYCHAHPHAADSVDGVRRWWLADPDVSLDEVRAALESLVTRGLLDVRWLLDGTAIYFNRAGHLR